MTRHDTALRRAWQDYRALRQNAPEDWPGLDLVALGMEAETMLANEDAFDMVHAAIQAPGAQGWARLRSALIWTGQQDLPGFATAGPPLFAEWCEDAQTSLRLRRDPEKPGSLILRRFTERSLQDNDEPNTGETLFLREVRTLVAHPRVLPGTQLDYHVFWGAPEGENPHALRRIFDRFAGFSPEENT